MSQDIQALLQTLYGTASAAQAGVPSAVNNGNPNTVYNRAWDKQVVPAPIPPPSFNVANLPRYDARTGPAWAPPSSLQAMDVRPRWGGLAPTTPVPPGTVTPPGGGTTAPPMSDPTPPLPTGGGGNVPPSERPGGVINPNVGGAGRNNNTYGNQLDDFGHLLPSLGGTGTTGGSGRDFGSSLTANGRGLFNNVNGVWGIDPTVARNLGLNSNGTLSWQQAVDVAQDFLLPLGRNSIMSMITGKPETMNMYLSQGGYDQNSMTGGSWDVSNMIGMLATQLTGLPVNRIMDGIGQLGVRLGWDDGNVFVNHYLDNATNAIRGGLNETQARMQNSLTRAMDQMIRDSANGGKPQQTPEQRMAAIMQGIQNQINRQGTIVGRGGSLGGGTRNANFAPGTTSAEQGHHGGLLRGGTDAGVITGDAARAYFAGMAASSDRAIREALAQRARKEVR